MLRTQVAPLSDEVRVKTPFWNETGSTHTPFETTGGAVHFHGPRPRSAPSAHTTDSAWGLSLIFIVILPSTVEQNIINFPDGPAHKTASTQSFRRRVSVSHCLQSAEREIRTDFSPSLSVAMEDVHMHSSPVTTTDEALTKTYSSAAPERVQTKINKSNVYILFIPLSVISNCYRTETYICKHIQFGTHGHSVTVCKCHCTNFLL